MLIFPVQGFVMTLILDLLLLSLLIVLPLLVGTAFESKSGLTKNISRLA